MLERHPDAQLRVYAIWTNKYYLDQLPGARALWDAGGLTDGRVIHFWDQGDVSGDWLREHVAAGRGGDWDVYYLFGPDARWDSQPAPLLRRGGTIIGSRQELEEALKPLLPAS